jgi:histidine triad (HIT) family protein
MPDCLFCKIAEGEIPSYKVYEDKEVLGFLDINPRAPGHTIVIPKAHYETILDAPEETMGPLWIAVRKVAAHVKEKLGADGLTVGINHGAVSGQTIPHLHIHIIPRFEGDDGSSLHAVVNNPGKSTLEEMVEKLKQ